MMVSRDCCEHSGSIREFGHPVTCCGPQAAQQRPLFHAFQQTFTWTCCKFAQYPKCSIYNPLLYSNKMLGHGYSSILLEQDNRLDIPRLTKGAYLEVHCFLIKT
ncbi:hypothetical protein AVEN_238619-1 [Araneus ventricosus]|uniref:Uncharacterized protein n=1 Tax=Araneus ventricosus TaxID=182803 RepID=A0A4Y2R7Q4_ARAVE|nr:hypothetical protein AVEN_238619-1 [Araneus ventricosus]